MVKEISPSICIGRQSNMILLVMTLVPSLFGLNFKAFPLSLVSSGYILGCHVNCQYLIPLSSSLCNMIHLPNDIVGTAKYL